MRGRLRQVYLVALGSNMRVPGLGAPDRVIAEALAAISDAEGLTVEAVSPVVASVPLGPSLRRYANTAAIVSGEVGPPALLALLQAIERDFGRRRRGGRWRARPLDLDIVLWSGGIWTSDTLAIPHREFRHRRFVLGPAAAIAPAWRDPASGLMLRHLHARLTRPRPLPTPRPRPSVSGGP